METAGTSPFAEISAGKFFGSPTGGGTGMSSLGSDQTLVYGTVVQMGPAAKVQAFAIVPYDPSTQALLDGL
jgi:hypothetical protein